MKNILGLLLLTVGLMLTSFTSIEMDDVLVALKSGNASHLSKYFDNRIDITLPEKSDNYSRGQAEMIIKNFFGNNGVKNFELKHKGESSGSTYCVGTLETKTGNYRTTLFMKQKGEKQLVQDIRFQSME